MKEIKLEVGKTYRSGAGEQVRIIGSDDRVLHQFKGNNGKSYTESGIFNYYDQESPYNLIEEVEEVPESTRIREWVEANIEYGCYTQDDIAEAIEAYLKHKEDEK